MRKAGGIIAIIAGVFGIFAAILTLMIGGVGVGLEGEGAHTVVYLGWGGGIASFLVIVFGAVALNAQSRWPGALLIVTSIAGAIGGGTIVALFMVLALIGGILALFGSKMPAASS